MILWLNPFSGISGDMLLGALIDLGAPLDAVRSAVASTGITGWEISVDEVSRAGMRGCQVRVCVAENGGGRSAAELLSIVGSTTPAPIATIATAAVRALAEVEAHIHGVPIEKVYLHELGGVDTVVDTVGVAAAAVALGVSDVYSASLTLGSGTIRGAHGLLPAPAPATLALLVGAQVVCTSLPGETVTPTGAALLRALGCRYLPAPMMTIAAAGYGAGSRDVPNRPNLLPALLGRPIVASEPSGVDVLSVVESTVDDVTGEVLGALVGVLLEEGALDAWLTPILGKHGRPGYVITALCTPARADGVERRLLRETGSLGARRYQVGRHASPRTMDQVSVAGRQVRIKRGPHRAKPEHDDVVAAAAASGLSLREISEQAMVEHHLQEMRSGASNSHRELGHE
jgi:uncharacterized protein (TIGR00299 family) protein